MNALAALSLGASLVYDNINAATSPDILDNIVRGVWHDWGKGAFTDKEAQFLASAIDRRRPVTFHRPASGGTYKPIGRLLGRLGSKYTERQRPRSPDRKASRDRRRTLGGSSAMPDNLRHHYTEGQRSVLCIVAGEVKRHGICDLCVDKIAALAGVCRTTVQTALHEARRLRHITITERPQRGRKNLPNVVAIVSPEWRAWIKRGPSAARRIGSNPVILVSTTKNTDTKKEGATDEKAQERGHGPPRSRPGGGGARAELTR